MTVTFADIFKKELCDHDDIVNKKWIESKPCFYETVGICRDCSAYFKLTRYKGFPVKYSKIK